MPPNLVNSLHTDSCPDNELAITESVNRAESTADNNLHQPMLTSKLLLLQMTNFQLDKT